jgi:dTDP-4-dehydrorhamnose reductase
MKILLTGCKGQVGGEVNRQAPAYDFDVVAKDSSALDITDIAAIRALVAETTPTIIINCAAYTAVDKAETDEAAAYAVNALGVQNLGVVAAEHAIPVLHISTDYIFDGNTTTAYQENDKPAPTGAYGRTKLAGEQLLAQANPQFITLRTSWVFGIEGNNFVKTMLRIGAANDEISVVADQFGCPTFAGHIARALLDLTKQYQQKGELPWGTYHFCDAGITTWHMFATTIMAIAEDVGVLQKAPKVKPILTQDYPTAAARPTYSVMDTSAFTTGFPTLTINSWHAALREMIQAIHDNKANGN